MAKKSLDICIIDDEVVVCKRLQQYLGKAKYNVETFVDSSSAVKRIGEKRFDGRPADRDRPRPGL